MSPRDQERLFPREYARELLRIARDDHESAAYLLTGIGADAESPSRSSARVRPENAAYLFQQAIEKALKASLCASGLRVPLIHDLGVLVAKIPDTLEPDFGYELSGLDEYATVRRYEEVRYILESDELEQIRRLSLRVLDWAAAVVETETTTES